jgi:hypothetical protein
VELGTCYASPTPKPIDAEQTLIEGEGSGCMSTPCVGLRVFIMQTPCVGFRVYTICSGLRVYVNTLCRAKGACQHPGKGSGCMSCCASPTLNSIDA